MRPGNGRCRPARWRSPGPWVVVLAGTAAVGCGGGRALGAQPAPAGPSPLDAVESALDSGRVEEARRGLARWFEAERGPGSRRELSRARFLRARLREDPDSAEMEYLRVALEGEGGTVPAAWLRLAQLHLAQGRFERALEDLERLRSDHPVGPAVAEAWLWTGLVLEAEGRLTEACEAWDRAVREAGRAAPPGGEVAETARGARIVCDRDGMRVTVQLGAFSSWEAARGLLDRVRAAGFRPRLEPPSEGLHRVRVGRFGSVEAARELAARVRASGFSAAILVDEP